MQRTAAIERQQVGDVDQRRDRSEADSLQAILHPFRRRAVLHAAHEAAREYRTGVLRLGIEVQRDGDWRREFARHRLDRTILEHAKTRGRKIARDAMDAGRVAAIGRQVHVDHRIGEAEHDRCTLADLGVGGQFDDAVVILTQEKLARRAQHAARFHAADGADLERFAADRNDDAGPREHRFHAAMCVGRAAHDLDGRAAPVIDHAELELVGVRMLLRRDDMRHDEILQTRAGVFHRLDFEADGGQTVGDRHGVGVGFQMLLEPGEREFHRLSPPSRVGRSSAAKP